MPAIITNEVFFGLLFLILAFYFVLISNLILDETYKTTTEFLKTYNQIYNNHKSRILPVNHTDTTDRTKAKAINHTDTIDQTTPQAINRMNTIGQTRGRAINCTNTIGQTRGQAANCTKTNLISENIF